MSPRTTEQYKAIRAERRSEILDAALHLFSEEGYHATSVSELAKKAKVSKGLMYNYFKSKEEVLRTLMVELFDYAMGVLKIEPGEKINDDRFQEIIALSIDIPLNEPQRWKLYMSLIFQKDVTPMLMEMMQGKLEPYMHSISSYFIGRGYDDPMAMMRTFSAMLDGIQMHCLLDPEHFPAEYAKAYMIKQFASK